MIESMQDKRVSLAPMMDWTTPEFRFFARLFNRHIWLYSEMVSTSAILHGDRDRLLKLDPSEHPAVLQLGGSDPAQLAQASRFGEQAGFDEINLNVGCPSDRVQHNRIGACLMAEPELVAELYLAMQRAVDIPVTIKHRIGIDDLESYEDLSRFVQIVSEAGCQHFIVHARIALLNGLSPKQNREVPPLRYDDVYRLKADFPELFIEINGGINQFEAAKEHLEHLDGVMIGRAFYHQPELMGQLCTLWGEPTPKASEVLEALYPYLDTWQQTTSVPLAVICRHFLGLFAGQPGSRKWRQDLSGKKQITIDDIRAAADHVLLAESSSGA